MSSDFGKRFIDARNASGITLEEVANATNIRHDYLVCIENGDYDFGLPPIYVRGFIKIYAKYLHLDVDEVMANCPIKDFEVLSTKIGKKISYNTIISSEKEQEENANAGVSDSIPLAKRLQSLGERIRQNLAGKAYAKIIGISIAVLLIVLILSRALGHKNIASETSLEEANKALSAPVQSISLIATGHVKVVVREKDSSTKLFTGDLEAGDMRKIPYSKPIQIYYDSGEYLLIRLANGEQLYPQPGRNGMEIK
ncbi:MAG: helix-turn-helix domain-containing protein [Puniceicoccales bacterium]|jgi:transcriptional regulator with XRE-family HTH domain|nr:helix-turn-helix domain-containing protein [Puniceicoccales bacterium]